VEIVTRRAGSRDLDRAAAVLGNAFADYPWTRWAVDSSDHQSRIVALQRIALEHLALEFGEISVGVVSGEIQSVAAWTDSAAVSAGTIDDTVQQQVAELEGSRHEASKAAEGQVEHVCPTKRHFYLGAVGTAQTMQGRGLATKTLIPLPRQAMTEHLKSGSRRHRSRTWRFIVGSGSTLPTILSSKVVDPTSGSCRVDPRGGEPRSRQSDDDIRRAQHVFIDSIGGPR
jgi:hypothetical protein